MIKKNDRVRLINSSKDKDLGILTVLEVKNGNATCGYLEYSKIHLGPWTFKLEELTKVE